MVAFDAQASVEVVLTMVAFDAQASVEVVLTMVAFDAQASVEVVEQNAPRVKACANCHHSRTARRL